MPCFPKIYIYNLKENSRNFKKRILTEEHSQFNNRTEETVNVFISDGYFNDGDSPMNFDYFIHSV